MPKKLQAWQKGLVVLGVGLAIPVIGLLLSSHLPGRCDESVTHPVEAVFALAFFASPLVLLVGWYLVLCRITSQGLRILLTVVLSVVGVLVLFGSAAIVGVDACDIMPGGY